MTTGEVVSAAGKATTVVELDNDKVIKGPAVLYCFINQSNSGVKSIKTYRFKVAATALSDGTDTIGHYTDAPTISDIAAISASDVDG